MASPMRTSRRNSQDIQLRPRRSSSQSRLPMAASRNTAHHLANTQPTYDFLSGPSRGASNAAANPFSQSIVSKPDIGNEDLRTQLKTLRYEIESLKQARDVTKLQHEKEVRDAQGKAEVDFKRAQASESSKHVTGHKYDALSQELRELQDRFTNEKHVLEKKLRSLQEENRSLKEEVDEAQSEVSSIDRQHKHQLQSLDLKHSTLQQTLKDVQDDLASKTAALQESQEKQAERDLEFGRLEEEHLKLRTQAGDLEELTLIRRELSEQVAHIRKLEMANREQGTELRHLRQIHKSVQIVEEEKRVLENTVQRMDDLQRELREAQFQREILENERRSWTAYLADFDMEGQSDFDSPEAVARALVRERMEKASLTERLGAVQPQISEKEVIILTLENERGKLLADLEKARADGAGGDTRSRSRLERQKALAIKEVAYLREQFKTFESEDVTEDVATDSELASRKRIQDLEDLVEQYRKEIETVNLELAQRDSQETYSTQHTLKRSAPDDTDDRLGQLSRKNRKLQSDIFALQESSSILQAELSATKSQLSSLQLSSKTRVLALRQNPTDDFENLKYSTIAILRQENKSLLAQLRSNSATETLIPSSSLDALRYELAEVRKQVTDHELMIRRLKEIFTKKTLEFREAVASILGWKMDFTPNGKFRLTSIFHPGADDDEGGSTNGIIFDGDKGEMKFIGGSNSEFAREVRGLVKFWVNERGEMPAFMAACQLEFYEKSTRALQM